MSHDIAKLILRLSVGIMILFHGIHKIIHGIAPIKQLTINASLPEVLAYGVYVGEVVMPILIILGAYARVASAILAINMTMAIYLAYGKSIFSLNEHGGISFELPLLYLISALMIALLGSGKFALNSK